MQIGANLFEGDENETISSRKLFSPWTFHNWTALKSKVRKVETGKVKDYAIKLGVLKYEG